tara:strand:- start:347 stop:694 length:348 start_codon:yes stop_codon:yes gene_type:complete
MIAQDYYFKGGSTMVTRTDVFTGFDFQDDKDKDTHIRIIGTKKEIVILAKEFMKEYPYLQLDEVYDYEVPKKDNHWYQHHCFGTPKEYKETMKKISSRLQEYKLQYEQEGSFILN